VFSSNISPNNELTGRICLYASKVAKAKGAHSTATAGDRGGCEEGTRNFTMEFCCIAYIYINIVLREREWPNRRPSIHDVIPSKLPCAGLRGGWG
jgi:hypothetical protein